MGNFQKLELKPLVKKAMFGFKLCWKKRNSNQTISINYNTIEKVLNTNSDNESKHKTNINQNYNKSTSFDDEDFDEEDDNDQENDAKNLKIELKKTEGNVSNKKFFNLIERNHNLENIDSNNNGIDNHHTENEDDDSHFKTYRHIKRRINNFCDPAMNNNYYYLIIAMLNGRH